MLELEKFLSKHCAMLHQKTRINWLKNGDRNSKFFNQAIQKRNHRYGIKNVVVEGCLISSLEEIKKVFF